MYTVLLAANEVSEVGEGDDNGGGCKRGWQGDDGWGRLLTMYVAWVLTNVLAANEVSEVGEMTMGVAAHHS